MSVSYQLKEECLFKRSLLLDLDVLLTLPGMDEPFFLLIVVGDAFLLLLFVLRRSIALLVVLGTANHSVSRSALLEKISYLRFSEV